jgi:hypothetical protein
MNWPWLLLCTAAATSNSPWLQRCYVQQQQQEQQPSAVGDGVLSTRCQTPDFDAA